MESRIRGDGLEPWRPRPLPFPLGPAAAAGSGRPHPELVALAALAEAGLPLAPAALVPAEAEARFYRLHDLPRRLHGIFAAVDPADPDEDDVEEAVPAARALFSGSYLLDEFVDAFYEAIAALPARVVVRRPGEAGREAARGRPALLALKRAWAEVWGFDEVMARLERDGSLAPLERPLLVHGAGLTAAPPDLRERVDAALRDGPGRGLTPLVAPGGGIARLEPVPPGRR